MDELQTLLDNSSIPADRLSAGPAHRLVAMPVGNQHSRHRIHQQGHRKPAQDFPQRTALHLGAHRELYSAGQPFDLHASGRLRHVRHTKNARQPIRSLKK